MTTACRNFRPFQQDVQVCDNCGELIDRHPGPGPVTQYRKDLWTVLLKHGGISSYFGGYDAMETIATRVHLGVPGSREEAEDWNASTWASRHAIGIPETPCSIDWSQTGDPVMDWVGEFDGTDCESRRIDSVVGVLYCVCGYLDMKDWCLKDKTLGQLIWLATKEIPKND